MDQLKEYHSEQHLDKEEPVLALVLVLVHPMEDLLQVLHHNKYFLKEHKEAHHSEDQLISIYQNPLSHKDHKEHH